MSERGSFCTEYIYCEKCLEAVKKVLLRNGKWLCSVQIPSWEGKKDPLPIIAGKIGGTYAGEELHDMEDLVEQLEPGLCHTVRISVMPDDGGFGGFNARPKRDFHNLIDYKQGHDGSYWWSKTKCRLCGMLLEAQGDFFSKPLPTTKTKVRLAQF